MPVTSCTSNGKPGKKWGSSGFCYTGEGAAEKAARQGRAIAISKAKKKRKS